MQGLQHEVRLRVRLCRRDGGERPHRGGHRDGEIAFAEQAAIAIDRTLSQQRHLLPGMDGLELLQHLSRQGIRMPAIVITAHGREDIAERCIAAGAVAFLAKPLQNAPLFEAIGKASRRAGSERHSAGGLPSPAPCGSAIRPAP